MATLGEIFQFLSIKNMETKKPLKLLNMIHVFDRVLSKDDVFTLFFQVDKHKTIIKAITEKIYWYMYSWKRKKKQPGWHL